MMPCMNIKIRRKLDMLKRVLRFCLQFPIPSALIRAITAQAEVEVAIADIERGAQSQVGGRADSAGNVQYREDLALELRNMLRSLSRIARVLDAEDPGLRARFRLPRTRSYPALVAFTRACINTVASHENAFVELGMPPTFLDDLRSQLAAFEGATERKISGKLKQVGGTSAMAEHAARGLAAAQALDACMQSLYRQDEVTLAIWKHARHIERATASSPESASEVASEQSLARHTAVKDEPRAFIATDTLPRDHQIPALSAIELECQRSSLRCAPNCDESMS